MCGSWASCRLRCCALSMRKRGRLCSLRFTKDSVCRPSKPWRNGTPVLASDASAIPEVLGDAALFVNAENVFDLARGIRQILTEDVLREALVRRGYALVHRYSWERSAAQVRAVYESVCAAPLTRR